MRRTPSQARSQSTVALVLEASAQVLRSHGYKSATTNRIAERAGVSVGSIYQYFSNKDEILDALLTQETATYLEAVGAAMSESPAELSSAIRKLLETGFQHRNLLLGMREVLRHAPESVYMKHAAELREALHILVVDFLGQHGIGGTARECADHADVLVGICESQVFLPRRARDEAGLVDFLHRAICHYLR